MEKAFLSLKEEISRKRIVDASVYKNEISDL